MIFLVENASTGTYYGDPDYREPDESIKAIYTSILKRGAIHLSRWINRKYVSEINTHSMKYEKIHQKIRHYPKNTNIRKKYMNIR